MKTLQKLITIAIFSSVITSSLQGQDYKYERGLPESYQNECNDLSAYSDGCYAAHWSSYATISVIVAAAIFFGIADKQNNETSSSNGSSSRSSSQNSHGGCQFSRSSQSNQTGYSNH